MRLVALACEADDDAVATEALRIVLGSTTDLDAEAIHRRVDQAQAHLGRIEAAGGETRASGLIAPTYACLTRISAVAGRRRALVEALRDDSSAGAAIALALEDACAGAGRAEVAEHCRRVLAADPFATLADLEQPLAFYAMEAGIGTDALDGWGEAVAVAGATARRTGSRLAGAFASFLSANWTLATGSVASAEAAGRDALEQLRGFGPAVADPIAATVITALTRRGHLIEAEQMAAGASPQAEPGGRYEDLFLTLSRGQLRLAQGRFREAAELLDAHDRLVADYAWEGFCAGPGRALLARARALSGDRERAEAMARAEADRARRRDIPSAEATALIALGHALTGDASLEAFATATEVARRAVPWTRAEAQFALGAALRRAGRRTEARRRLTEARETAERIDAGLIADAAQAELLIAGGRPRRGRSTGLDALTPSERRVAEHAAGGLTNREIAETLFVTRKTVELHLGNTFGKLGIRSRTQLAGILGGEAAVA
jgi:DNA-binding CsgD family transcriptional regulator